MKNNTPRHAGEWSDLETIGDVRRGLRWTILSVAADKMETRKGAALGQLLLYMLKAMESEAMDKRLAEIEHRLDHLTTSETAHDTDRTTATH
jgi:hypothetical protein